MSVKHQARFAFAIVALALSQVADAAPLDAKAFHLYGGTYAAKCSDPQAQHLKILADHIAVVRGTKELRAGNVDMQYSYFGNRPPGTFEVALVGAVKPNVGLVFLMHKDQRGRYIQIDGHPTVLRTLGQRSNDATRYYACAAATQPSAQSSASPKPGTTVAAPQWRKTSGGGDFDLYIDAASIRKTGNLARVSILKDHKRPYGNGRNKFSSFVIDEEFDCAKRKVRWLRVAGHAQRMGQGAAKFDKEAEPFFITTWETVGDPDEDISGNAFNIACGRK